MLRAFGQCAAAEVAKIKTREARFDPPAAGQFPQKNTGLRRTPSKPFCDALLDRSNIEPGPEVVTAHLRAPQVHVTRAAARDVPEGRIQFKLPLFFT